MVRLILWPEPVELEVTVRAVAAPAWTTLTATAAVPLVPFTVRPTTELALGVTVFAAVETGIWNRYDPDAGAA